MSLYEHARRSHSKLVRGMVWCTKCGRQQNVDSGYCLQRGWPECCGETMTIDSPEEREARIAETGEG